MQHCVQSALQGRLHSTQTRLWPCCLYSLHQLYNQGWNTTSPRCVSVFTTTRRDSNMYRTCCFALYYPLTSLRKKHQRGVMDSLGPWNIIWILMWKFRCCSQKIFLVLMLPWESLIGVTESHWRTVTLQCINYTCFPGHGFKMSKKYQNDFSDRCLRSTGSLYEVQWACCVKCSQPCHLHLSDTDGEIRKDVCGQSYCSEDAFMIRHSVCTEPGSTMTWTQRNINAEVWRARVHNFNISNWTI